MEFSIVFAEAYSYKTNREQINQMLLAFILYQAGFWQNF